MTFKNWLATSLFVLSFPGFYIYHYAAASHLIPLFAGGLASWVNMIGCAVLAPFILFEIFNRRSLGVHVPIILLISIMAAYVVYHRMFGNVYTSSFDAFEYNVKMIIGISSLYLIGYFFSDSDRNRTIITIFFVVLSVLTLMGTYYPTLSFMMGEVKLESGEITSSYQGFSTAYTIVCVTLLALTTSVRALYIIVYVGTICVFFLVSRSELLGFACVVSMLALILLKSRELTSAILLESGMILIVVLLLFAPKVSEFVFASIQAIVRGGQWLLYKYLIFYDQMLLMIENLFVEPDPAEPVSVREQPIPFDVESVRPQKVEGNYRQLEILDLQKSESLRQRLLTFEWGWKGIKQSPILGDYAGQIRDLNNPGAYMHNMLSVWRQFGIVAFIIYLFVSMRAFLVSGVKVVLQNSSEDKAWRLVLLVSVYTLSLAIVSKSIYWPLPAFAWGLFAARLVSAKGGLSEERRQAPRLDPISR